MITCASWKWYWVLIFQLYRSCYDQAEGRKHYQIALIREPVLTLNIQAFLNSFTNTMLLNILLLEFESFWKNKFLMFIKNKPATLLKVLKNTYNKFSKIQLWIMKNTNTSYLTHNIKVLDKIIMWSYICCSLVAISSYLKH